MIATMSVPDKQHLLESPLRIAFAMINCNRREGSARAVNEVMERLASRGHEVHVYARKVEDLDLHAVHWHRVPGPGWPAVANFWTYNRTANRILRHSTSSRPNTTPRFDIVHSIGCNTVHANVITIQNVQPAKTAVTKRFRSDERVSLARRITRAIFVRITSQAERKLYTASTKRLAPMFLPVSRGVERELRQHYDIGEALVRIIPNAADVRTFKPLCAEARKAWRARIGLVPTDFLICFAGGEWARKGLDIAIRTVALLQGGHVKLFVAGDDADRARFQKLASKLGVSNRVIFGGFRNDISESMGSADLFLFPSHYEAFSLATIEAAACGLPIVAARINGTEDFITPGVTGAFVNHDPENIADLLRPLIADLPTCRRMGENARHLVERNYTWDRITRLTEEAYVDHLASGLQATRSIV